TSYPPATELRPIAGAAIARELDAVRRGGPISIYVHVPFCRSLCWYCGCNVIPTRDTSRGDGYVDLVATELALAADALGPGFPIGEIAPAGVSPNFLTPKSVRLLITTVHRYFTPTADIRRSVELDPRSTTSSQIETFAAAGFRAMSVGVQDFSDAVQDAIHR